MASPVPTPENLAEAAFAPVLAKARAARLTGRVGVVVFVDLQDGIPRVVEILEFGTAVRNRLTPIPVR